VRKRGENARDSSIAAGIEDKCLFGTLGNDFEDVGVSYLVKGGSFPIRLVHGEQEQEQEQTNFDLPIDAEYMEANEQEIFALLAKSATSTPQQRAVFARCTKNFPVADMVTSSGQLLNMTINTKHNINCPTLTETLEASGIGRMSQRKLDLYFCLPPGLYENFNPTWSNEEGFGWVKQRVRVYALLIPLVLPPFT
jgi:hypothetical protein